LQSSRSGNVFSLNAIHIVNEQSHEAKIKNKINKILILLFPNKKIDFNVLNQIVVTSLEFPRDTPLTPNEAKQFSDTLAELKLDHSCSDWRSNGLCLSYLFRVNSNDLLKMLENINEEKITENFKSQSKKLDIANETIEQKQNSSSNVAGTLFYQHSSKIDRITPVSEQSSDAKIKNKINEILLSLFPDKKIDFNVSNVMSIFTILKFPCNAPLTQGDAKEFSHKLAELKLKHDCDDLRNMGLHLNYSFKGSPADLLKMLESIITEKTPKI